MFFYCGYYCAKEEIGIRYAAVSAISKMDYIFSVLQRQNQGVQILSRSYLVKNESASRKVKTDNSRCIKYFSNISGTNRLLRVISRAVIRRNIEKFCKENIKASDTVVIYHSADDLSFIRYLKRNVKCKIILELEEIYSDVRDIGNLRDQEKEAISLADCYIIAVESMKKVLPKDKPYIVINGTYLPEPSRNVSFNDGKIHCVYAGTFAPTKGSADAVTAAEFLPENYHVHILGFGTNEQKRQLLELILNVQKKTRCTLTYDGLKSGEEYIQFLQKCQIGLCTQIPDAKYSETSFPSKVLVYLANGLRVLSVRTSAIENSEVGPSLYYYDIQTPQEIAKAILSIPIADEYDSRKFLSKLDNACGEKCANLLETVDDEFPGKI